MKRILKYGDMELFFRRYIKNSTRLYSEIYILFTHTHLYTMRSDYRSVIIYARYRVSRSFAVDRSDCDRDQRHATGIRKRLAVGPTDFSHFAIESVDHFAFLFKDHHFSGNIYFCTIQCLIIV